MLVGVPVEDVEPPDPPTDPPLSAVASKFTPSSNPACLLLFSFSS